MLFYLINKIAYINCLDKAEEVTHFFRKYGFYDVCVNKSSLSYV